MAGEKKLMNAARIDHGLKVTYVLTIAAALHAALRA